MLRTIPLILLILLVYVFRLELYMAGTRFYILVAENPKYERILGDYYQDASQKSKYLADNFYDSSLKKFKAQLNSAPEGMKPDIQYQIGLFYECGKGGRVNLTEAKRWYEEAAKNTNASPSVQQALARINAAGTTQPAHATAPATATATNPAANATPATPTTGPAAPAAMQSTNGGVNGQEIPACNLTNEIPSYLR